MANLSEIAELIPTLCGHDASTVVCLCEASGPVIAGAGAGATSEQYEARMLMMNDDEILAIMQESAAVERQAALFRQIAIGIAVARSARPFGHGGLAAKKGHRSVTSLVQDLLGVSHAEAARQVSVSGDLVDTTGTTGLPDSVAGSGERTPDPGINGDAGNGGMFGGEAAGEDGNGSTGSDDGNDGTSGAGAGTGTNGGSTPRRARRAPGLSRCASRCVPK